jgi:hypothetical protein
MEPEVIKAIPRSSVIKRVVIYIGIGLLLGWAGESFFRPVVTRYLSVDSHEEFFSRLQVLAVGLGIFELSIAIYLAVIAARIIRSQQSPYPGATVWRDTPIVRGKAAVFRGWSIVVSAACLLGFAIYVAYLPHQLAAIWRAEPHSSVLSR